MKNKNYIAISLAEVKEKYTLTAGQQSKNPDYWNVYSPEIVQIIDDYVLSGEFPYNRSIEELVNQKLFPEMQSNEENRIFSHIVYTTQSFVHDRNEAENDKKFEIEMEKLGYFKATEEFLQQTVGTDKRFNVVLKTTNVFGSEGKKAVEVKFRLKDWGNQQGFHWMKPGASRSGYKAMIGQFVKQV